jgi:hypothetical protein
MNQIIPTIFSLLCAGAGWYYLMHAGSAAKLGSYERPADNLLRIRLRRWGGILLVMIAIAFYIGFRVADADGNGVVVALSMLTVIVLLPIVLLLALVDMKLTRKMRESFRNRRQ